MGKREKKSLTLSETTCCLLLPPNSILAAEFIHGDRASLGGEGGGGGDRRGGFRKGAGVGGKEQIPTSLVDLQRKKLMKCCFFCHSPMKKTKTPTLVWSLG